jgi:hypothetical protein
MSDKETRGGRRENSGRHSTWNMGETKPIKVPVAIADKVMSAAREIDREEYHREFGLYKRSSTEVLDDITKLVALVELGEPGYSAKNAKKLIEGLKKAVRVWGDLEPKSEM